MLVAADGVENGGEVGFDVLFAQEHDADGEGDFGVDAVFGDEVQPGIFAEEGVVLRIAEVGSGPFEKFEECGEGVSVVTRGDFFVAEFFAVASGDLHNLHRIEAAFEMDV